MSWWERAYAGQKVVRIPGDQQGGDTRLWAYKYSFPEVGEVCTIKTINHWRTGTLLTFFEHDNSYVQQQINSKYEPGFPAEAFRPVHDTTTEVEKLKKLCLPTHIREEVR